MCRVVREMDPVGRRGRKAGGGGGGGRRRTHCRSSKALSHPMG